MNFVNTMDDRDLTAFDVKNADVADFQRIRVHCKEKNITSFKRWGHTLTNIFNYGLYLNICVPEHNHNRALVISNDRKRFPHHKCSRHDTYEIKTLKSKLKNKSINYLIYDPILLGGNSFF